jgi:Putative peptidoglycan binding domain
MSRSSSISRSKRQTTAAAVVTAAALATLAWSCAAPAAQATGGRGADADIPGSTAGTPTTRGAAVPTVRVLSRGAGYERVDGSDPVRRLQRDLRGLDQRPGPIDGLYGPLTQGAVERFQSTRGLTVDGVVGPQTRRSLVRRLEARRSKPHATPGTERGMPGAPDHPGSPATEPVPSPSHAEGSSDALPAEWAAVIAVLALALLVTALWALSDRRREVEPDGRARAGLNVGLAFACLLAVLAIGASGGALFASQAAPGAGRQATAEPLFSRSHPAQAGRRLAERSVATPRPLDGGSVGREPATAVSGLWLLRQIADPQLR